MIINNYFFLFYKTSSFALLSLLICSMVIPGAPVTAPKAYAAPQKDKDNYIIHVLQKGETLTGLAQKYYGDSKKYHIIAEYNNISDMNMVKVGQSIMIPLTEAQEISKPESEVPKKKSPPEEPQEPHVQEKTSLRNDKEFLEAMQLFQNDKYSEARNAFEKIFLKNPDDKEAQKYLDMTKQINSSIKKGTRFYYSKRYEDSFNEFSSILELKDDSQIAQSYIRNLISPMVNEARKLIDKNSPCNSRELLKKVLKHDPNNTDAQDLMKEAENMVKALNLTCE